MLGRFLEFSLATPDILASYEYYRSLGFAGVDGAETYRHRYGVVAGGGIALGLHETEAVPLALTFVHADLAVHAGRLRDAGVTLETERLSQENLNELGLADPDGHRVRLIEARTFSPLGAQRSTLIGWFDDLVLPVGDLDASVAFWERLGFVRLDGEAASATLTSDHLSITLDAGRRARPALRFAVDDLSAASERLRALGLKPAPTTIPGATHSVCVLAPEGTELAIDASER